ncbi:hypothetical protein [Hydrogenimonas sp.]
MAFKLHIEAEGRKIGFYRLNRLEMEGLDIAVDEELEREDILELFETINGYVESGELDALGEADTLTAFDPETASVTLDADSEVEVEASLDDLSLKNVEVDKKLELLENARIGDIVFVRTETGDAYWDFSGEGEAEFSMEKVTLGYLDCTSSHDEYQVLRESYYDFLCDLVLPEEARYGDEKLELDEHVFRPQQVFGELFIVRQNLPDRRKEFEKVDLGGPVQLSVIDPTDEFA